MKMSLKLNEIEIDPSNIFENDKADRETGVKAIGNLIDKIDSSFVMAIDSQWGNGKTTFVRLLQMFLEHEKSYKCLYFNAWQSDFSNDPLISFLGELKQLIKGDQEREHIHKEMTKVGSKMLRGALPSVIHLVTGGAIDSENMKALINSATSEYENEYLDKLVESYDSEKKLISKFRVLMKEFISKNSSSEEQDKVIVFIDELDRCKPTFAVELLERLKHLFNVDNLVFVLSIDKKQLGVSLAGVYGQGIDSDEYLRRFIDLEYSLPMITGKKYTEYLVDKFDLPNRYEFYNRLGGEDFVNVFSTLSHLFSLSMRARNQCFTRITIALLSAGEKQLLPVNVIAILTILKTVKPELYHQLIFEKGRVREAIDYLESKDRDGKILRNSTGAYIVGSLIFTQSHEGRPPEYDYYNELVPIVRDEWDHQNKEMVFAHQVVESYGLLSRSFSHWSPQYVIPKIELASHFET